MEDIKMVDRQQMRRTEHKNRIFEESKKVSEIGIACKKCVY